MRHGRNLRLGEGGQDLRLNLLPIDPLRRWPVARKVVAFEPSAEVGNGRRCPVFFLLANGIGTAVDRALESLSFLARCSRTPIGNRADGIAALGSIKLAPVVEDERSTAGG